MNKATSRLLRQLVESALEDRADATVVRPVLTAMVRGALADFERFYDRRHASNRVRDFDILQARNRAAAQR